MTKFVVGLLGLGIAAAALWFGRTGGKLPVETAGDPAQASAPNGDDAAKEPENDAEKRPPISPKGPYPKVAVDEDTHNFSTMAVGADGSHGFEVRNEGEAPLVLVKGPSTCKCTISELANGEVPPGGSTEIQLTWKARAVSEQFRQTATIYTNDPEQKELKLSISGKITKTVEVSPPGAWTIDDIASDAESTVGGMIYSHVLDSFELEDVQKSSDKMDVEILPLAQEKLDTIRAKAGYQIVVTLQPGVPVGVFREKLTFKLKDQELDPIEILVEGKRTGPISFLGARGTRWNPGSMIVHLGDFDAEQGASGSLLLFVGGQEDEELKIVSVESDPDSIELQLTPDPDFKGKGRKKYELTFEVPPGARRETRTGRRMARVIVKTNHPDVPELKFRLDYISR